MEKMGASKNKVTKCLLKCLSCLMACFERFIRFLTRNAYIMVIHNFELLNIRLLSQEKTFVYLQKKHLKIFGQTQ